MGVTNTVYSRTEVNEQNARIERHLTLIGTAMTCEDFHKAVGEKLLDVHSCPDKKHCDICRGAYRASWRTFSSCSPQAPKNQRSICFRSGRRATI